MPLAGDPAGDAVQSFSFRLQQLGLPWPNFTGLLTFSIPWRLSVCKA